MMSAVYDALSSTEINNLLRRAIGVIAAGMPAGRILIQDIGAVDANSSFSSSIGWDRATAAGFAHAFAELPQLPGCEEEVDVSSDSGELQGSVYIPSAEILEKYALGTGIFVIVPCRDGNLAALAGNPESGVVFSGQDALFLRAMMNMLSLAVESEHAELVHTRNMQQVIQAKHQWESTLDALPQLVCLIDENGHVIRSNRTLKAWGLGEVSSVRGKHVHDVIHPGCSDWDCVLKTKFSNMLQQLRSTDFVTCEYHNSNPGQELRCSINKCGKSKYVVGEEEDGYAFLVIEDISLQKRAERVMQDYNEELERRLQEKTIDLTRANAALRGEIQERMRDGEALRKSEKKYTCLVETTLTGLYVMQDKHIVFSNNRFAEIFGYTQEEIGALDMQDLFPEADGEASAGMNRTTMDEEWSSEEKIVKGVTRDGRELWLQRNLTRVDCSNEFMIMGNIIDITVRKNTEDALRRSQCELRILSGKILEAQEAERKRIASELHDSIGQSITAIKFGMENAMREYESGLSGSGKQYLRGIVDKLRDTIAEVRNISMNLRPSILDDLGLKATIKWFVREFVSHFPAISVNLQIDVVESELSDPQKTVIFRVIQEALNNIGKHAEAGSVSIELLYRNDMLTLLINDDGSGILPETLCLGQGFGVSSMRNRVELSGGEFDLDSIPGDGTLVRAAWPVVAVT
jgi:PAS domain S-box-containing protein